MAPEAGAIVKVRSRQYLVEEVVPRVSAVDQTLVRLSCLDDDAQGNFRGLVYIRAFLS